MQGKKFLWTLSRGVGGGAKALSGRATKKRTFIAASLIAQLSIILQNKAAVHENSGFPGDFGISQKPTR